MEERKSRPLAILLKDVVALRAEIATGGTSLYRSWRRHIDRSIFAASTLNFAHYLVMRRIDLRRLQRRLMVLGLSSLGRSEGHVLTTLDTIIWALARLSGSQQRTLPSERQFFRGERKLRDNTIELFGPPREGRVGRIMVTLGREAADDPGYVSKLASQGADVVRINCGHDDSAMWKRMIDNTHAAARIRPLRVLMDIGGPKVRMKQVVTPLDRRRLLVGDKLLLCRKVDASRADYSFQSTCAPVGVLDRLKVGDTVSIDDGKLRGLIFAETDGDFAVNLTEGRIKGVKIKPGRGLNFPTVDLNLDPLTDKDRRDLDFVVQHADIVGFSFVQNGDQIAELQKELAARRPDWQRLGMVAKIETPAAVSNLPEIIVRAAGRQPLAVMIARGDLAVELGFERVAEMQEEILWLCEAAHVPAIWATQVLDGLIQEGLPSRSEMTDAAMAVQAEVVMLNKGPNLAAGVSALDRVLRRMGENRVKKTPTLRALRSWPKKTHA
ncbi:MAG: pyruvate kinase [Rhizomicrobium sp.]